jgi:alpha-tubulin suppressor-like RCC1 family protein
MKSFTHQLLVIFSLLMLITTSLCKQIRASPTATIPSPESARTQVPHQPTLTVSATQPLPTTTGQVPLLTPSSISAGDAHTCVLTAFGRVKCWGENRYDQLGDSTNTPSSVPVDVKGLSGEVVAVEAGGSQTCVVTAAGGVKCWGDNHAGQIGDGRIICSSLPVEVVGLDNQQAR